MTEAQEQSTLFRWTLTVRDKHPELALLFHIPNGGKRDKIEAANLKRQGVKKGVPDMHLPVSKRGYHSLFIELKTETGKTSPEQDWWLEALRAAGNFCAVCHGWRSAARTLEWYLDGGSDNGGSDNGKV